jgi:hypothetical protein
MLQKWYYLMIILQGHINVTLWNMGGTGELLVIPLFIFASSLLVFWIARSKNGMSTIQRIHKSVTESSANGLTNLSLIMTVVIIYLILFVGKVNRSIGLCCLLIVYIFQYNLRKPVDTKGTFDTCASGLSINYFGMMPFMTILSCSWFVWNNEARQFIFRKWASGYPSIFERKKLRVHPRIHSRHATNVHGSGNPLFLV